MVSEVPINIHLTPSSIKGLDAKKSQMQTLEGEIHNLDETINALKTGQAVDDQ